MDHRKFTPKQFAALRGKIRYISNSTRPDVAHNYEILTQTNAEEANEDSILAMNSIVHALKTTVRGIIFPKSDHGSMAIRGYADAGFARNYDLYSQLSMVVALIDKYGNASLIHYATRKSRRIVRSTLAAEFYALSTCHEY